jgi:hypothetical protein
MVYTRKITRKNMQTTSSSLDFIKEYTSEEEMDDSDYKYNSDDDQDYSDSSSEDSGDDDNLFTRNEKTLFERALNSGDDHWTDSDFYNYLFNKYIKHIFYFSKDQEYSPREWSDYMITMVNKCGKEDYKNLCRVQDIDSYVGTCFFRNQTRTLSKCLWLDGTDYCTGTRCAEMMLEMTRFFVMVENEMANYQKDYSLLSSILNKLENILVDFESD